MKASTLQGGASKNLLQWLWTYLPLMVGVDGDFMKLGVPKEPEGETRVGIVPSEHEETLASWL